jgi:hypothetical protein
MKKLKVSLSAMALLLGVGAALATTPQGSLDSKKWALNRSNGQYEEITGQQMGSDYTCNLDNQTCTAEFPSDVNPNDQDNDAHPGTVEASNRILGQFSN